MYRSTSKVINLKFNNHCVGEKERWFLSILCGLLGSDWYPEVHSMLF